MIGKCRLCGKCTKLTFEHVPPQSVFNSNPVKSYDGNQILDNTEDFENGKLKYKNMQRGSGGYYLCGACNSFTGKEYNTVYQQIANYIGKHIIQNTKVETTGINFETKSFKWLRFFKQIITMFIDTSDLCCNDDKLKKYILDVNNLEFDFDKYRLFCYATNYQKYKPTKIIGRLEIDSFDLLAAEITAFPLGFLLLIDESKTMQTRNDLQEFTNIGMDITSLASLECNCECSICTLMPLHRIDNYDSILEVLNIFREQAQLKRLIESGEFL